MSAVRPPTVNLARRPFRNNTVYWGVFTVCFILLLVASAYNVYDFSRAGGELERLGQEYAERERSYLELREEVEKMKKEVSSLDLTTLNSKSSFANTLLMSHGFSWSSLFDRLEELTPAEVRIRSIRPSISPRGVIELQIDGMAQTPEHLYEFELALAGSIYFSAVYPVSENSKESRGEINFDLTMNYVPAGKPQAQGETTAEAATTPGAAAAGPADGGAAPQAETPAGATQVGAATEGASQAGGSEPNVGGQVAGGAPSSEPSAPATNAATPGGPSAGVRSEPSASAAATLLEPPPSPVAVQRLPPPPKPPREMTNKEFLDWAGQERLIRIRGRLKPAAAVGKDATLTNEQFIVKHGIEEFIKERGSLPAKDQRSVAAPPAEPNP